MCRAATESKEMRITYLWPQTAWPTVWKNLGEAPVPGATKAAWYKVIHDILPIKVRLFRICMVPTDACRKCDRTDTVTVSSSVGKRNKYGHGQNSGPRPETTGND